MINLQNFPPAPGCYLFKDKSNKIIYIGKAKNLKKRVTSYFSNKDLDPKTNALVLNIKSADFIITDNEVEALILENNLIKKNSPKYNIDLKDSKRYAYINITDEDFPRLIIARKKTENGKFFGPFTSGESRDYLVYILNKVFMVRTCKRLPKKACLRFHIGLCSAPCVKKISEKDYAKKIKSVEMILKGRTSELEKNLKIQMKKLSAKLEFERALEIRNQIKAIGFLHEKQKMERQKKYDEDILNFAVADSKVYLILFNIRKGILENKQEFIFENFNENFLEEFILQYYSENNIPREIILPREIEPNLIQFLESQRRGVVNIIVPKQGEKKQLLELVRRNIEISFFGELEKLNDLQKKLNLNETPEIIECFDISHISGTSSVGSMIQFRNAKPDKSGYRRFKIRTVEGVDDFAAIAEIVRRRYTHLKLGNLPLPNLIIIDGGVGQLNFALRELEKLNLKIPIISIAKQFEEIYIPGKEKPLRLDKRSRALKFVQEVRDEAHRFAIGYHKLLRRKEFMR